uniref:ABC transporter permease n=1 Tax=Bacillus thuringiensis TaxID=1428 RepID=UPI001642A693
GIRFIISKLMIVLVWMMMVSLVGWWVSLILGVLGNLGGFKSSLLLGSLVKFLICGGVVFVLCSRTVVLTVLMKRYVSGSG